MVTPRRLTHRSFALTVFVVALLASSACDSPGRGNAPARTEDEQPMAARAPDDAPGVAPVITSPPRDLVVSEGSPSYFKVLARGTPPVTYRWKKEGRDGLISSQPELWFVDPAARDSGTYRVEVSNRFGAVSATCRLTVHPRRKRP